MGLERLFRLDGRVALVTGASSGLGARFAEVAAEQGARVVLVGRRADKLNALQEKIGAAGGKALAVAADVRDAEAMTRVFEQAERDFGVVDLFVANAGTAHFATPTEVEPDLWRETMSLNLDAAFFGCQMAADRMMGAGKPGAIITSSSTAGLRVPVRTAAYAVSKAALIHATRLLALDLGPKGIRVNGIAPGWVMTEMTQEYLESDAGKAWTSSNPLGRYGQPEDLDGVFLFLASDASSMMTGQTIAVDAGQLLRSG